MQNNSNDTFAYDNRVGLMGTGREKSTDPTPPATWKEHDRKLADRYQLEKLLNGVKSSDHDFHQQLVSAIILSGQELSPRHLQIILAVLRGDTDYQTLRSLLHGWKTITDLPGNILSYNAVLKGGRPRNELTRARDIRIAEEYELLRKILKSHEAYERLSSDSYVRYGTALSVERVKSCVTRGRKYIKEDIKRIDYITD